MNKALDQIGFQGFSKDKESTLGWYCDSDCNRAIFALMLMRRDFGTKKSYIVTFLLLTLHGLIIIALQKVTLEYLGAREESVDLMFR